jgi:hypothetical protein
MIEIILFLVFVIFLLMLIVIYTVRKNKKKLIETNQKHLIVMEELKNKSIELENQFAGQINDINQKYLPIINRDEAIKERETVLENIKNEILELDKKYENSLSIYKKLEHELGLYKDSMDIIEYGIYEPIFDFATSEQYKQELEKNYEKQKICVKNDKAVIFHVEWQVHGSAAEGRKMMNQYKKLMLLAFNGECDSLIAKVKWNNASRVKERIEKSFENINKLGKTSEIEISIDFLKLKLKEFALTYEYEQKKYEEKEEQRRIREQMREEEKVQRELDRAQREAEDEEKRYQKALDKAKQELLSANNVEIEALNEQIKSLENKLSEAHERKERAISLAQMTKVGHIYVISNIGSFGENVYKIGMTRRLDPVDRVKELGDASVPFAFDVHAIIYSENAPQLENEIHKKFNDRRLNRINNRREFFRVTLDEVESFVKATAKAEIQFTKVAEAKEYRETLTLVETATNKEMKKEAISKFPEKL